MAALAAAAAENPAPAHDAAVTAADFRRTGVQGAKCVHLGAAFLVSSPQGKTKSLFALWRTLWTVWQRVLRSRARVCVSRVSSSSRSLSAASSPSRVLFSMRSTDFTGAFPAKDRRVIPTYR